MPDNSTTKFGPGTLDAIHGTEVRELVPADREGIIVPQGGTVTVAGTVTKNAGAEIHGQLTVDKGGLSAGVDGGISQKKGWGVSGFLKWVWGK